MGHEKGGMVTNTAVMPVINVRGTLTWKGTQSSRAQMECEWTGSWVARSAVQNLPQKLILWLASLLIQLSNIALS